MTLQVGDLIPIGGSGDVKKSEVLEGKTYSSDEGVELKGTMPNHGSLSKTITTQGGTQKITPGYYSGGEVKAQFNNLVPENIKDGVNVGGVVGILPGLESLYDVSRTRSFGGSSRLTPKRTNPPEHSYTFYRSSSDLSEAGKPRANFLRISAYVKWDDKNSEDYDFLINLARNKDDDDDNVIHLDSYGNVWGISTEWKNSDDFILKFSTNIPPKESTTISFEYSIEAFNITYRDMRSWWH